MTASLRIEPEISGVGIVLAGNFNPAIFTPAWFALHGLLPKGAAESAQLEVAYAEATNFTADWLHLSVTSERFSVETVQSPDIRLRDLVLRTFQERLHHTPLQAFGINRNVHFLVRTRAERDLIGRTLAPIEPWGAWAKSLDTDDSKGGMTSLTMSQIDPEGRPLGGRINVKVEPSLRVGEGQTGVYVNVNDHYQGNTDPNATTDTLIPLLDGNYETSIRRSDTIIDHIMGLAKPHGD